MLVLAERPTLLQSKTLGCTGTADDIRFLPERFSQLLSEVESGIMEHMNSDHAEASALIAQHLGGGPAGDWRMVGVDPEGADFRDRSRVVRVDFDAPIESVEGCREALVALTRRARERAGDPAA